jgi:hypothetical protein
MLVSKTGRTTPYPQSSLDVTFSFLQELLFHWISRELKTFTMHAHLNRTLGGKINIAFDQYTFARLLLMMNLKHLSVDKQCQSTDM